MAQAQKIKLLQKGTNTSIRGLCVVNNKVAWISGSNGYVALSIDAGTTWKWLQVKGYEQSDFRDIEAFTDKEAIIMSSGTPALILKTTDGGSSWKLNYNSNDKSYFLDAMDFANKNHGFVLGDPIGNQFLLLETKNGGNSWHLFNKQPKAEQGEAAFAASGTCLRLYTHGRIGIVSGGTVSRYLLFTPDYRGWISKLLPIRQGKSSQGAFSTDQFGLVFVGGDYSKDRETDSVAARLTLTSPNNIKYYLVPSDKGPAGFQSCVEFLKDRKLYISTGTSGSNISVDGGRNWRKIDSTSYNVCRTAKYGSLVLLAGDNGKIGTFIP